MQVFVIREIINSGMTYRGKVAVSGVTNSEEALGKISHFERQDKIKSEYGFL